MDRRSRFALVAALLTTLPLVGCATTQSYLGTVPRPRQDAYSCALQKFNELEYVVQDADREAGFIRGEKETGGFVAAALTGATRFNQITVSVFEDVGTGTTRMRVSVGGIEEAEGGFRRGSRKNVPPTSEGRTDGQAILSACGAGGTVAERSPIAVEAAEPENIVAVREPAVRPSAPEAISAPPEIVTEQVRVTAQSGANIRAGAGTNQPILLAVQRGTVIEVLRRENDWFVVRLTPELGTRAETGFIHRSTVEAVAAEVVTVQAATEASLAALKPEPPVEERPRQEPRAEPRQVAARPQQTAAPAGETVGRWGVGLKTEGDLGLAPSVHYNASERVVLEGSLGIYDEVTTYGGQVLYRFLLSSDDPTLRFEPVAGGGVHLISVETLFGGSESVMGVSLSGGAFLHLPQNAHWRFRGTLSYWQFNYEGTALKGANLNFGAFYFF